MQASRKAFSFTKFRRTTRDTAEVTTQSDPRGEFSLRWRWVDYYNRFQLSATLPTTAAESGSSRVLARLDLSDRIRRGSPVVSTLVVKDTSYLESLRGFLADLDSEDEHRIHDEMGAPDKVQKIEYPGYDEVTWWYFGSGRAYRFREGRLEQVVHFDFPVTITDDINPLDFIYTGRKSIQQKGD